MNCSLNISLRKRRVMNRNEPADIILFEKASRTFDEIRKCIAAKRMNKAVETKFRDTMQEFGSFGSRYQRVRYITLLYRAVFEQFANDPEKKKMFYTLHLSELVKAKQGSNYYAEVHGEIKKFIDPEDCLEAELLLIDKVLMRAGFDWEPLATAFKLSCAPPSTVHQPLHLVCTDYLSRNFPTSFHHVYGSLTIDGLLIIEKRMRHHFNILKIPEPLINFYKNKYMMVGTVFMRLTTNEMNRVHLMNPLDVCPETPSAEELHYLLEFLHGCVFDIVWGRRYSNICEQEELDFVLIAMNVGLRFLNAYSDREGCNEYTFLNCGSAFNLDKTDRRSHVNQEFDIEWKNHPLTSLWKNTLDGHCKLPQEEMHEHHSYSMAKMAVNLVCECLEMFERGNFDMRFYRVLHELTEDISFTIIRKCPRHFTQNPVEDFNKTSHIAGMLMLSIMKLYFRRNAAGITWKSLTTYSKQNELMQRPTPKDYLRVYTESKRMAAEVTSFSQAWLNAEYESCYLAPWTEYKKLIFPGFHRFIRLIDAVPIATVLLSRLGPEGFWDNPKELLQECLDAFNAPAQNERNLDNVMTFLVSYGKATDTKPYITAFENMIAYISKPGAVSRFNLYSGPMKTAVNHMIAEGDPLDPIHQLFKLHAKQLFAVVEDGIIHSWYMVLINSPIMLKDIYCGDFMNHFLDWVNEDDNNFNIRAILLLLSATTCITKKFLPKMEKCLNKWKLGQNTNALIALLIHLLYAKSKNEFGITRRTIFPITNQHIKFCVRTEEIRSMNVEKFILDNVFEVDPIERDINKQIHMALYFLEQKRYPEVARLIWDCEDDGALEILHRADEYGDAETFFKVFISDCNFSRIGHKGKSQFVRELMKQIEHRDFNSLDLFMKFFSLYPDPLLDISTATKHFWDAFYRYLEKFKDTTCAKRCWLKSFSNVFRMRLVKEKYPEVKKRQISYSFRDCFETVKKQTKITHDLDEEDEKIEDFRVPDPQVNFHLQNQCKCIPPHNIAPMKN